MEWSNDEACQCQCKNYRKCKKIIVRILAHVFENYLKSIADTLVIVFNEIINGADSVSTNVENIMPTNIANTISINVTSTALQQIMMIKSKILILIVLYWMENHTKIFWFMTFHIKLLLVQNLWVLFSIM